MDICTGQLHLRAHAGDVKTQRRHAHNFYVMGRRKTETGALLEAQRLLQRALHFDGGYVPALCALAQVELALDHPDLARRYAETAVADAPTNTEALFLLGNIALNQHDVEAALNAFQRASAAGGEMPELAYNTGLAHLYLNHIEAAEEIFTHLLEDQPTNHRVWDALGCTLRIKKDYQGATSALLQALQLEPGFNDARDHLAQMLLETGNAQRACQVLEVALSLEPERSSSRHFLAMAYAAMQQYAQAASCWEMLIIQGSATAECYHLLANAYLHLQNRPRAVEALRTLLSRYPDHVSGHLQLALLLMEDGQREQGLHHLEIVRKLDPQHSGIAHALAAVEACYADGTATKTTSDC